MSVQKKSEKEFTGLFIPAELLAMRDINMVEKAILTDIGYFNENSYRVSNNRLARKIGVHRLTIINSIQRLKAKKKIVDTGKDIQHRRLKLNGEMAALFEREKKTVSNWKAKNGNSSKTIKSVEPYIR